MITYHENNKVEIIDKIFIRDTDQISSTGSFHRKVYENERN